MLQGLPSLLKAFGWMSARARDIQEETKDVIEADATTIQINALREAYGYETDAEQARAKGELAGTRGKLDAMDTILSGGVRAAGYYWGKQ